MAEVVALKTIAGADANAVTVLATNHAHLTQNENHRDVHRNNLMALTSCWGTLLNVDLASPTQFTMASLVYQDLTPWNAGVPTPNNLTVSAANGTLTVPSAAAAGTYDIDFNVSLRRDTWAGGTDHIFVKLMKNGVEVLTTMASLEADGRVGAISAHTQLALVNGDVLKLQIALDATAGTTSFMYGDFTARRFA